MVYGSQGGASKGPKEAFPNRVITKLGTEGGVEGLAGEDADIQVEVSRKWLALWTSNHSHELDLHSNR